MYVILNVFNNSRSNRTEFRSDLLGYYVHGLLRSVMYEPDRGLFVLSRSDRCSAVMSSGRCKKTSARCVCP